MCEREKGGKPVRVRDWLARSHVGAAYARFARAWLTLQNIAMPLQPLLRRIQYHEHEISAPGDGDHLLTTPLALSSALNDSGQIEHLDLRPLVHEVTGNARERRELIISRYTLSVGDLIQQTGLAHTGETNQRHTGVSSSLHVESVTFLASSSTTTLANEKLGLEFGKLCFQSAKVIVRCLVLLSSRHLMLDLLDFLRDAHGDKRRF